MTSIIEIRYFSVFTASLVNLVRLKNSRGGREVMQMQNTIYLSLLLIGFAIINMFRRLIPQRSLVYRVMIGV